jgi:hypothetical protein
MPKPSAFNAAVVFTIASSNDEAGERGGESVDG